MGGSGRGCSWKNLTRAMPSAWESQRKRIMIETVSE